MSITPAELLKRSVELWREFPGDIPSGLASSLALVIVEQAYREYMSKIDTEDHIERMLMPKTRERALGLYAYTLDLEVALKIAENF